jgi:hypothetical protein
MENQALGLAEAVARQTPLDISVKRLTIPQPYPSLPRSLWRNPFENQKILDLNDLSPPFPDLWIACGRLTLPFSIHLKKLGGSFVVQTQDPRERTDLFDFVVPPKHDGLSGANVFPIHGSPNRLTAERIAQDAQQLEGHLPADNKGRIAVLIGGDSKAYTLSSKVLDNIIAILKMLIADGYFLMITTSRRTGDDNIDRLQKTLAHDHVFFWDGSPVGSLENPYFGMLGLADHILVTEESTNMVTDAAATGKPVHVLPLEGQKKKFEDFHNNLQNQGITRKFSHPLESWDYTPLQETDRAAEALIKRWLGPA